MPSEKGVTAKDKKNAFSTKGVFIFLSALFIIELRMTVYIEYAFLQNFFLDGALVWLSLKGSKTPVKGRRIALSALVGGVFAVLYPLLGLTKWLGLTLKISVGVLLSTPFTIILIR